MAQKYLRVWKTLSRKTILEHGKFLTVENHVVELPNGTTISDWAWIIIPNAAIVLPVTPEGKFLCFRQTKYAVQGTSLAPVGGMIEENEDPFEAAKRELREEMGCEASNWVNLGSYVLDPNRRCATMHLFLALDAKQVTEPESDDLEDQELLVLSKDEIKKSLREGEFKIVAWAAVVALSLDYLDALED
jgi:ADP-ribose pyrophosphatase